MPTDNRLLEAALAYARQHGWPVFPLRPGDKRPLPGSHGFKDATTDLEAIRRAWAGARRNIGLPPGRAGLVVLDLDVKHGADGIGAWEALAAELGCNVPTLASRTPSGGQHLFFRCPPGVVIRSSQGRVRPGIDVRSRGGYVVLAPSRIRVGPGWQAYAWDPAGPEAQPIAPLPEPLADLLLGLRPPAQQQRAGRGNGRPLAGSGDALAAHLAALARAQPGTRNDQLNRSAFALGQLVAGGSLDLATVKTALRTEARRVGLGEREIRATIRSGLEAGLQKPRPERVFSAGAQSRPTDKSPGAASPEAGTDRAPPGNRHPQARGTAAAPPHPGRRYPLTDYGNAERLAARFLHREWFEFVPAFKLFLATNHKPVIRGTDRAIWRRIRMVPFRVTIPEAEQDRTLGETLWAEAPGILAWAVRGCLAWQREGLGAPPDVTQATAAYRREMDVLGGFLADCCVVQPGAQATVKALYEAYGHWCQANGESPLSKIGFGSRLRERGLEQIRETGGQRCWQGIGLLSETE